MNLRDHWFASGDGTSLIKDDSIDSGERFDSRPALHQNAAARCDARSNHDGRWRGEPKRARACNNQNRNSAGECHFNGSGRGVRFRCKRSAPKRNPCNEREYCCTKYSKGEPCAHAVSKPRHWGAIGLRILHHLDDLLQNRIAANLFCSQDDRAHAVQCARKHFVARAFRHRDTFTSQHRLIKLG